MTKVLSHGGNWGLRGKRYGMVQVSRTSLDHLSPKPPAPLEGVIDA